jgi:hypothetical protein
MARRLSCIQRFVYKTLVTKEKALGGDIFGFRTRRNESKSGKNGNGHGAKEKNHIGRRTIGKIGWEKRHIFQIISPFYIPESEAKLAREFFIFPSWPVFICNFC